MKFENYTPKRKISVHSVTDLQQITPEDIFEILAEAIRIKTAEKVGETNDSLAGKHVVLITTKHQGIGQLAFSTAVSSLSGQATILPLGGTTIESFLGDREVAEVLSGMGISAFVVETSVAKDAQTLVKHVTAPVINAFAGGSPCGSIAAIMAVYEHIGRLFGLKVAYISNGEQSSILTAMVKCGMDVTFVAPEEFKPSDEVLEYCRQFVDADYTQDVEKALSAADVVFVANDFNEEFKLTNERLSLLKPHAAIIHKLPLTGASDADVEILDFDGCLVSKTAINVTHVEKACLELLCGKY